MRPRLAPKRRSPHAGRAPTFCFACLLAAASGCSRHEAAPSPEPSAKEPKSAPVASATPAPSAEVARAKSWFAGAWSGAYRAEAHRIDLPTNRGGIPEWKADDGKGFVGAGTIELACADDGTVSGTLHGALGEHELLGESDEQSLRARFFSKSTDPPAFTGTVALTRTGSDAAGDLRASTADGRVARTASVTVTRIAR